MVKERWRDSLWPPYLFGLLIGGLAVGVTLGLPMSAEHNAYRALRDSLATARFVGYSDGYDAGLHISGAVAESMAAYARRDTVILLYLKSDSSLHVTRIGGK